VRLRDAIGIRAVYACGPIDASVCMPAVHASCMGLNACMRARARGCCSRVAASGHEMLALSPSMGRNRKRGPPALCGGTSGVDSGSLRLAWHCLLRSDLHLRVCARMSACIYISVSVQMYFVCIRACMYVYACMSVCPHVSMCMCACVYMPYPYTAVASGD
jgi:hypothetical protein